MLHKNKHIVTLKSINYCDVLFRQKFQYFYVQVEIDLLLKYLDEKGMLDSFVMTGTTKATKGRQILSRIYFTNSTYIIEYV